MRICNVSIIGRFDSVPDPSDLSDPSHRVLVSDIEVRWLWRAARRDPWLAESLSLYAGTRWDGASRPDFTGWLVPRWGVFSAASLVHDICFGSRPMLSNKERISRKHADMLYLHLMRELAEGRVESGMKELTQLWLAEAMYSAVRWFGAPVWDKHDEEFA